MKILQLEQNSREEKFADARWVNGEYVSKPFDEIAEKYPKCLLQIRLKTAAPPWGYAWYKKAKNGFIELYRENWDTSG